MKKQQLTLPIGLRDDLTFENFYPGGNQQVITHLQSVAKHHGEKFTYIYGPSGVGCSHLLQAACHVATQQGFIAAYLPLKQLRQFSPQLLQSMETLSLICIDDIAEIVGDLAWEEALFHLYNRAQQTEVNLIFAAIAAPKALTFKLPDLASRLTAAIIFSIHALNDEEKLAALQLRANQRGFDLPTEAGQFLLRRCPRDNQQLFAILDQLDKASLMAQRKLSIPFIKEILAI